MNEPNKRRTEITIETHSLTIIRTRGAAKTSFVYCRNCRKNTATFAEIQAALIFRVALPEIERLFQTNQIHLADNAALCGNSLAGFYDKEIRYVED